MKIRKIIIFLVLFFITSSIIWKIVDARRNLLTALPVYPQKGLYWLGISTDSDDSIPLAYKNELWLVEFAEEGAKQHFVTTLNNHVDLVDCHSHPGRFCVANKETGSRVFTFYEWDVISNEQLISSTLEIPESIPIESWIDIVALIPSGTIISQGGMNLDTVYFLERQGTVTKLFESAEGCQNPVKLSPDGQRLAILCLGTDWLLANKHPFDPLEQHIYLVELDGSKRTALDTPPTYYFNEFSISAYSPVELVPDFTWSPNSKEIAFVASFSSPSQIAFPKSLVPGIGSYDVYGGIYRTSNKGGLTKWVDTGSWYPALAWSPDGNYLAYSQHDGLYVVSRQGKRSRINRDISIRSDNGTLSWSPDGAYLIALGRESIWIMSTRDYSWNKLNIPLKNVYQIMWISDATP